jgi:hypothetical protein
MISLQRNILNDPICKKAFYINYENSDPVDNPYHK